MEAGDEPAIEAGADPGRGMMNRSMPMTQQQAAPERNPRCRRSTDSAPPPPRPVRRRTPRDAAPPAASPAGPAASTSGPGFRRPSASRPCPRTRPAYPPEPSRGRSGRAIAPRGKGPVAGRWRHKTRIGSACRSLGCFWCLVGRARDGGRSGSPAGEMAFWRRFLSPVQGRRGSPAEMFSPKPATFLCHLHRKMPDLDWHPPPGRQTAHCSMK